MNANAKALIQHSNDITLIDNELVRVNDKIAEYQAKATKLLYTKNELTIARWWIVYGESYNG